MKVFVFDLDFTLWDAGGTWCDATNPPYQWRNGKLLDSTGAWIRLYDDVFDILKKLKDENKCIVAASRTYRPDWAQELLHLFEIDVFFDLKEIFPADKTKHFKNIQNHFNLPYAQMVFFDDEYRNIEVVSKLGVESVYVKRGVHLNLILPYL